MPVTLQADCAYDHCSQKGLGGTISCSSLFLGDPATLTCGDFSGCFTGSPLGDTCATNIPQEYHLDEKHFRLSRAIGYNSLNYDGYPNLSAFKFIFSPTDPSSGYPDKEYLFGSINAGDAIDDISFTQEVIGIYLIPNLSPDFEGICFLLEDGSIVRIG